MSFVQIPVEILVQCHGLDIKIECKHDAVLEKFVKSPIQQVREPELYRLKEYSVSNGVIHLRTECTDYVQYKATRSANLPKELRWNKFANPLAVCCVCSTSDGFLMVERRSSKVDLYPGAYHVVGGYSEVAKDRRKVDKRWIPDFQAAICREVEEELGGAKPIRDSVKCLGLLYDSKNPHPELVFACRLGDSHEHLRMRAKSTLEFETVRKISEDLEALAEFLNCNLENIVPTGLAALLLWGNWQFSTRFTSKLRSELIKLILS